MLGMEQIPYKFFSILGENDSQNKREYNAQMSIPKPFIFSFMRKMYLESFIMLTKGTFLILNKNMQRPLQFQQLKF